LTGKSEPVGRPINMKQETIRGKKITSYKIWIVTKLLDKKDGKTFRQNISALNLAYKFPNMQIRRKAHTRNTQRRTSIGLQK
jgi:hypothetical protein